MTYPALAAKYHERARNRYRALALRRELRIEGELAGTLGLCDAGAKRPGGLSTDGRVGLLAGERRQRDLQALAARSLPRLPPSGSPDGDLNSAGDGNEINSLRMLLEDLSR